MERRLARLQTIWPRPPCDDCRRRPAVVCVPDDETPAPRHPEGPCPACGRMRWTVPILVGTDCDAL